MKPDTAHFSGLHSRFSSRKESCCSSAKASMAVMIAVPEISRALATAPEQKNMTCNFICFWDRILTKKEAAWLDNLYCFFLYYYLLNLLKQRYFHGTTIPCCWLVNLSHCVVQNMRLVGALLQEKWRNLIVFESLCIILQTSLLHLSADTKRFYSRSNTCFHRYSGSCVLRHAKCYAGPGQTCGWYIFMECVDYEGPNIMAMQVSSWKRCFNARKLAIFERQTSWKHDARPVLVRNRWWM